jgi:hypothetical protein
VSKKLKVPIPIIILAVIALACGQFKVGFEPNSGVSIQINPNPGHPEEKVPRHCPLSDLNVYVNGTYGYCFAYPIDFTVTDINASLPEVRGPVIRSEIEPVFPTLRVEVEPTNESQSLREQAENYLREFSMIDPTTFTWQSVEVDGQPGLMVEPIPVQLSWKIIFVRNNSFQFHLMYWPVDVREVEGELAELYQVTTQTFEFFE